MSLDLMHDLVSRARAAGADAADAVLVAGTSLAVQRRLGRTEQLERSEMRDLGLRVFVGRRSAIVSSTTVDPAGFGALAERAVDMARIVPEDPYAGLADEARSVSAELDMDDVHERGTEPAADALIARASAAEEAALALPGITNSEGAEAGYGRTEVFLVTSAGFAGSYARTNHSVSATALAGEGTSMQRDYDYSSTTHLSDLEDAAAIGRYGSREGAGTHEPRAAPNRQDPGGVRPPRVAQPARPPDGGHQRQRDRAGHQLPQGPSGPAYFLARNHDPRRSTPAAGATKPPVRWGRRADLPACHRRGWRSDDLVARQPHGPATRARHDRPCRPRHRQPTEPGTKQPVARTGTMTPAELMADIKEGLYITEMMGSAINSLTGDYSRGASGFMIRDGALAEPVAEITVAGNLLDMFLAMIPANDLRFRRGTDAPTVRVDGMTLAGA